MAKQFDPKYDFPERIYFTNAKHVKDFIDAVGKKLENYGQIMTLIDFFDILSAFESDTYGEIIAEYESMNGTSKLCNYGWRVNPIKTHHYMPSNADGYKWVLRILSPIFLEKENEMTYKDIKTRPSDGYSALFENAVLFEDTLPKVNIACAYLIKGYFKPKKILKNGPATIFFWKDGSKTVIKATEGEEMDLYSAFCIAAMKRIFGTNSAIKSCLRHTLIEGDWK